MSREVFEYFYEIEELEPHCSELPAWATEPELPVKAQDDVRRDSVSTPKVSVAHRRDRKTQKKAIATVVKSSVQEPVSDTRETRAESGNRESINPTEPNPSPPLSAPSMAKPQPSTPERSRVRNFISVHALGQSAFCVRSAIQAIEQGDEQDIDEPPQRLTYLKNFLRDKIEEQLSEKLRSVGVSLLYAFGLGVFMVVGVIRQERIVFYPALFISMLYLQWLVGICAEIVRLVIRRRAAINAEAREPDPQVNGIQAVNWWSLLKAGYEPVNHDRQFRHPELPLEGNPWRVLERGSTKIPVIRSGVAQLGAKPGELYDKHQIRLVGYALLLESMGHVEVPFGLVVPVDSPHGLAMKITPGLRARAIQFLEAFATKLHDSQQHDIEPRLPDQQNRCAGCKYGEPVPISPKQITSARKAGERLLILQHGSGKTYHCQCGDRFGSAPPHAKSVKLGLSAALG